MENEIFETMPVPKAYLKMALPLVMGMVVSLIYNMVDTYFIALTHNVNLIAGVSLAAPIFTMLIALGDILGLGGSTLISRLLGQKNDEQARSVSVLCFYGSLVEGAIVTAVLLLFQDPILTALGTNADTYAYTVQYYRYIALGAPFVILSFSPSNQLRSEGLSSSAMVATILGTVLNMILDPIMIFGLNMGAAGAAIATVIGYIVTDLYLLYIVMKKSKKLSANPKYFRVTASEIGAILTIGIPASITNFMQSFGIMLTNRYLLPYGNDKVAVMGIVMKINMIAILILVGFAFGGQVLVGYNYGANNRERFQEICRFSYRLEVGLAVGLSAILILLAKPALSVFLKDAGMIQTGIPIVRFQMMSMFCVAFILVTSCICQAVGNAMGAFLLSITRQGVIFAAVIFVTTKIAGYWGVLCAQAIADLLTAGVAFYYYRKFEIR